MKSKRVFNLFTAVIVSMMLIAGTFASVSATTGTTSTTTTKTTTTTSTTAPQGTPPSGTPPQGTPPSGGPGGTPPSGSPGDAPGGNSQSSATVTATAVYMTSGKTASKSNTTFTAKTANQSGVIADKSSNLTLKTVTVNKTAGDTTSEDQSNFYGVNAGVVAKAASKITISNSKINTSAKGANGIFSTGTNSTITVSNTVIKTTKDSSRGLDATMGGKINATNMTISTRGAHCASIATDRGNGTITVNGGTMSTAGEGSPAIYSTGTIKVSNTTMKATGSEAAVIEGKNSITLNNVKISGTKVNGVMLYQSYSGDAEVGTSVFTMTGGTLSSQAGSLFFVTNTDAVATLKNVNVKNATDTLITAAATTRWGTTGSNGGKFAFTADSETLSGKVIADKISSISMTLKNKTAYTGSINTANKLANVTLTLDAGSKWTVTADSYVKALTDKDTSMSNIKSNGHTIYYDATNSANSWLGGKTITLSDGGKVTPAK